jgi:hypothetical protein
MTNEPEEYGYTDIPPQGAHSRANPPSENKASYERPMYEIPPNEAGKRSAVGDRMNYAVLIVAGLLLLSIFAAYLYQTGAFAPPPTSVSAPPTPPVLTVTGDKDAVRIELVRTIDLLNQIELKLLGNPNELAEVRQLKEDAKSLIALMEK